MLSAALGPGAAFAAGRSMSMHPFMHGTYPGSGAGPVVIAQAGLDGKSQYERIAQYVNALKAVTR